MQNQKVKNPPAVEMPDKGTDPEDVGIQVKEELKSPVTPATPATPNTLMDENEIGCLNTNRANILMTEGAEMQPKDSLSGDQQDKLQMNLGYVVPYLLVMVLGLWHTSWAMNGNTMTTEIFKAKLEWDDSETMLYNTIITSAGVMGMIPGSILGGRLIQNGRRQAAIKV